MLAGHLAGVNDKGQPEIPWFVMAAWSYCKGRRLKENEGWPMPFAQYDAASQPHEDSSWVSCASSRKFSEGDGHTGVDDVRMWNIPIHIKGKVLQGCDPEACPLPDRNWAEWPARADLVPDEPAGSVVPRVAESS